MKNYIKKVVVKILTWESKRVLQKQNPKMIAITGNIGKTTTKDYIYTVLKTKYGSNILASKKSQNSEFGVTLTILNQENPWNNIFGWLKVMTFGFYKSYFSKNYPELLVLEIGADHKGDIEHITTFVKPEVVVLTAFQEVPTHGEFFKDIEEHIAEKAFLVDALKVGGTIIYNSDDKIFKDLVENFQEVKNQNSEYKIYSYGKKGSTDIEILGVHDFYEDGKILGLKVILKKDLESIEIILNGVLGEARGFSVAAAVLMGILEGMDKTEIESSFENIEESDFSSKSRMCILEGLNNSTIIDDTYNASPEAFKNALASLKNIETTGKKIVVLGHMAELGEKKQIAHADIAGVASEIADVIILSGRYNDLYLKGLKEHNFPLDNVRFAKNADEVTKIILQNDLLQDEDIILLKGSQSARLEKTVVKLLANLDDLKKVCRQEDEWNKR